MNEVDNTKPAEPDQKYQVSFLLVGQLRGIMFNPHLPDGITIRFDDPAVEVALSGVSQPITYRALGAFDCGLDQSRFVRGLIERRYISMEGAPLSLPHIAYGEEKIAADGAIKEGYGLRQHHLPSSIQALAADARGHLTDAVSRLVRLFRWAQNVDAPHNVFNPKLGALYWQVDPAPGEEFHGVPLRSNAQLGRSPIGIRWADDDQQLIWALLSSTADEPLAHEMQREGIALWSNSPRSSVLALCSALEVGVKQHVAAVAPHTAWLMEEMPAPPIYKILRHYLPRLHEGRSDIRWEGLKKLCKSAQDLAEVRNKVAHTGKMPPAFNFEEYVSVVTDWLYFLDFLGGQQWAATYVGDETRKNLRWPPSPHQVFYLKILAEE